MKSILVLSRIYRRWRKISTRKCYNFVVSWHTQNCFINCKVREIVKVFNHQEELHSSLGLTGTTAEDHILAAIRSREHVDHWVPDDLVEKPRA